MKTIQIAAKTDVGKVRDQNEDAFILCPDLNKPNWELDEATVEPNPFGTLLVVADGMGGTNAGEVASSTATKVIKDFFNPSSVASAIHSPASITQFLKDAVRDADKAINKLMVERLETAGMGTTIVICWLLEDIAYIAWCGDSRCYVFNKRQGLKALTKDHSYVQELVDQGKLSEEEAFTHPQNNIITRGLGDFDTEAVPDIITYTSHPGDMIMLCSDGLCGYCTDKAIEKTMKARHAQPRQCVTALLKIALEAGGGDNITVATALISNDDGKPFFKKLFSFH